MMILLCFWSCHCLHLTLKEKNVGFFDCFLSFLNKYEANKTHNMLSLMLDPKFKSLRLVSFVIGWKLSVFILEEYDKWSLFLIFLKCYCILCLMVELGLMANMQTNEKCSLDIFEMSIRSNEPKKKLVNKELQMFRKFQTDVKDTKCPLEWWGKHECLFWIVTFLACQFFFIVG